MLSQTVCWTSLHCFCGTFLHTVRGNEVHTWRGTSRHSVTCFFKMQFRNPLESETSEARCPRFGWIFEVKTKHWKSNSVIAIPSAGFFLVRWPKNSRTKKLKLKEIFSRKLKKPANRGEFGANFDQKLKFQPKNRNIWRKTGIFLETFAKLKPEICQILMKPAIPQIPSCQKSALKKPWTIGVCHDAIMLVWLHSSWSRSPEKTGHTRSDADNTQPKLLHLDTTFITTWADCKLFRNVYTRTTTYHDSHSIKYDLYKGPLWSTDIFLGPCSLLGKMPSSPTLRSFVQRCGDAIYCGFYEIPITLIQVLPIWVKFIGI